MVMGGYSPRLVPRATTSPALCVATANERLVGFLKVRGEATCAISGRELAADDKVTRLSKCRHYCLTEALRKFVLSEGAAVVDGGEGESKEEEEEAAPAPPCYERHWKRAAAKGTEAQGKRLACPRCKRSMSIEHRD